MIEKSPLCPERVRKITGSFAFLEHRFVRDAFWTSLSHHELLLYLFLVLVADRNGLSYYSFDKICGLLQLSLDDQTWPKHPLHQCGNNRLYSAWECPRHRRGREAHEDAHNRLCIGSLSLNHNCMQISEAFSSPVGVR